MRYSGLLLVVLCCTTLSGTLCLGAEGAAEGQSEPSLGERGGICVVVDFSNADMAISLAEHEGFVIHALFRAEEELKQAREAIQAAGLYGRISADHWQSKRLPYADNLINVMVVDGTKESRPSLHEVKRALAPLGVAYLGGRLQGLGTALRSAGFEGVVSARHWNKAVKPWPAEIDEWTHFLHNASGNAVSKDTRVRVEDFSNTMARVRCFSGSKISPARYWVLSSMARSSS